jgi:hypothetical protein
MLSSLPNRDLQPSGRERPFALVTRIFNNPLRTVGGAGGGVEAADLSFTPTIPAPAGPAPGGLTAFWGVAPRDWWPGVGVVERDPMGERLSNAAEEEEACLSSCLSLCSLCNLPERMLGVASFSS